MRPAPRRPPIESAHSPSCHHLYFPPALALRASTRRHPVFTRLRYRQEFERSSIGELGPAQLSSKERCASLRREGLRAVDCCQSTTGSSPLRVKKRTPRRGGK